MNSTFHDATLLALRYEWASRALTAKLKTSDGERELLFGEVVRLEVPQERPWGPSASINYISSTGGEKAATRFEVHMQSGDVIMIESDLEEYEVQTGG